MVKSIKFTKHPLNQTENKPTQTEKEKPKEKEIQKSPEKNEILIPEPKGIDEEIKHLNTTEEKKLEEDMEKKLIEDKPEVLQAKNTLKVFDTIVRVIQIIIVFAIIAYIYS